MEYLDPSKLETLKLNFDIISSDSPGVPVEGRYAIEYISRAKDIMKHLENLSEEKRCFALSDAYLNCKHAIDYQIDTIFHCLGILNGVRKNHYNFPKKMELLKMLGITSPNILRKISTKRNKIVHEHSIPSISEVEDAIGVAELFFYATNRLSRFLITGMTVYLDSDEHFTLEYFGNYFKIKFPKSDYSQKFRELFMKTIEQGREIISNNERNELYISFEVDITDEKFLEWLIFFIQLQS